MIMYATQIHDSIYDKQITQPTLIFTDESSGNTLWGKYIKSRNRIQIFGKDSSGNMLYECDVAVLMEKAGLFGAPFIPTSERGKRMVDFASTNYIYKK